MPCILVLFVYATSDDATRHLQMPSQTEDDDDDGDDSSDVKVMVNIY